MKVNQLLRVIRLTQNKCAINVGCDYYGLGARHWPGAAGVDIPEPQLRESQGRLSQGEKWEGGRSRRMKKDRLKDGVSRG